MKKTLPPFKKLLFFNILNHCNNVLSLAFSASDIISCSSAADKFLYDSKQSVCVKCQKLTENISILKLAIHLNRLLQEGPMPTESNFPGEGKNDFIRK